MHPSGTSPTRFQPPASTDTLIRQLLFLAPLLLLAPPPVTAREAVLDEITVLATRRPVGIESVSEAVTAVDGDEVVSGKLATDALRNLVGVNLQQTTPGQGAAIIRGLKGSAVLHLVDGMRLSNAMFRTAPTPWFALVPTSSVERLEVIRGTPASLYGSEAVGGVVQSVSRLPDFDSEQMGYAGNVVATFDTAELQKAIRATLDLGTQRLSASFSTEYLQTGDRRVGSGERIGPSGYSARALRAVVRGRPSMERSWFVDLHYLEQPDTPRIDELVPGFGQTEPSSSEFSFAPNRRVFAHVQHEVLAASGIDWKVDAAWQRIDDDRKTRDLDSSERRLEDNRSDLYGLTINASAVKNALSWIAGVDLYHDEVRSSRFAQDVNTGASMALTPRFPDGSAVAQAGLFGNMQWHVADRHNLTAGLRYSDVRIDLPDGTSINPGRVSGDLGWIFKLSDSLHLVANAGSGFRAPNIADLGTLGNRPGNRFNIPNSSLSAEDVIHGDLGLRYRTERLRFEVVLFALRYSDRIVSVSTGELTADGRDIVQSVNAAASTLRGVEAGLDLMLSERLDITAVMNYARGEQTVGTTREPADRVPPLNGRVELRYAPGERWRLAAWVAAASAQDRLSARDVRDVRIDPNGTAGWASIGASVTWDNGDGWQVTLGADNLADKEYRTHGSGIDAPGRNLSATFRHRW